MCERFREGMAVRKGPELEYAKEEGREKGNSLGKLRMAEQREVLAKGSRSQDEEHRPNTPVQRESWQLTLHSGGCGLVK